MCVCVSALHLWIVDEGTLTRDEVEPRFVTNMISVQDISSRVIDTAASQLTKTAITVTAIFIVAIGYDSWYFMLGYAGAIRYIYNTPIQIIGKYYTTDTS